MILRSWTVRSAITALSLAVFLACWCTWASPMLAAQERGRGAGAAQGGGGGRGRTSPPLTLARSCGVAVAPILAMSAATTNFPEPFRWLRRTNCAGNSPAAVPVRALSGFAGCAFGSGFPLAPNTVW